MRKHSTFILLFIAVILISSCRSYRHIYSPTPPNNPAFREKGESELSILYSGTDGNNGIGDRQKNEGVDIQSAYAITNHLAVTGNYYFRKERDIYGHDYYKELFDSSVVNYKRKGIDFSVGYFTPFNERKKGTFSFYAGYTSGHFNISDHGIDDTLAAYTRFYEADLHKWYLQPGFNFWFGENVSLGLTLRYSFIHFTKPVTSYNQREQEYFFLDKVKGYKPTTFEPTLSLQFSIPPLNWLKICASTTAVTGWLHHYPSTRAINGSVGLAFNFSRLHDQHKVSE